MINKKIFIGLIIIASFATVGCSKNISKENKVIDSVVIDEDAKGTANSTKNITVTKALTTENLSNNEKQGSIIMENGKLLYINYTEDGYNKSTVQFPKLYISSIEIGTITDEVYEGRNIIKWDKKDIEGQLLTGYMDRNNIRILKDNKVYMLDDNCELKEIKSYKRLLEETNGDLNRFDSSENKKLDIYSLDKGNGIEKKYVIDTVNDNYYEISGNALEKIKEGYYKFISISDNKIYITIANKAKKEEKKLGYVENNEFYNILPDDMNIKISGGVGVYNDKILFSGYVEGENGIWSYDINKKNLVRVIVSHDDRYFNIDINNDNSMVAIAGRNENYPKDAFNLTMLSISNKSEMSILENISIHQESDEFIMPGGWSKDGKKFYLSIAKTGSDNKIESYYEVYEVKE